MSPLICWDFRVVVTDRNGSLTVVSCVGTRFRWLNIDGLTTPPLSPEKFNFDLKFKLSLRNECSCVWKGDLCLIVSLTSVAVTCVDCWKPSCLSEVFDKLSGWCSSSLGRVATDYHNASNGDLLVSGCRGVCCTPNSPDISLYRRLDCVLDRIGRFSTKCDKRPCVAKMVWSYLLLPEELSSGMAVCPWIKICFSK
jgi:hypothetical protein